MALHLPAGSLTVDNYHRLGELGVLTEDDRVELIHGQVVPMTPIGERHAACVRRLNWLLARSLRDTAGVDVQNPVVLDRHNQPQPDLALLAPRPGGYPGHPRPEDILLLIEVADSSLTHDRDRKLPLYARASIPEVWIVDLDHERVEVYREPRGEAFAHRATAARGGTIQALRLPSVSVDVDAILG